MHAYNDDLGGSTSTDDRPLNCLPGNGNPEYGGGGGMELSTCIYMDHSNVAEHNVYLVAP